MAVPLEFVKYIEIQYLLLLSNLLKIGQIDVKTAKETARMFLTFLPFQSFEDVESKMKTFVEKYKIFEKLNISVMQQKEEVKTKEVLTKMNSFMK